MRPWAGHFISESLLPPLRSGLLGATSHGAPSWMNIPRLLVLDSTVQLFLWLPGHKVPQRAFESSIQTLCDSHILWVGMEVTTLQTKSVHLPSPLLSQISNPDIHPPCISSTTSQAQWEIWKKNNLCPWSGDDNGNEFLLTAYEVSGPAPNTLLASSHLILKKSLLGIHNIGGNWDARRLNDLAKISQLGGGRTKDLDQAFLTWYYILADLDAWSNQV